MADVEWNGDDFLAEIKGNLGDNLEAAAIYLQEKIKMAINRSQPYDRWVGEKGVYYKGQDPSGPDEPPKKVRGDLQRSIAYEMSDDRSTAFVGSNLDYALFLELGTSKMEARPFLRSTLAQEQETVSKIIATGRAT